ncbi:MAG TPA: hypothetical protein DDY31_09755 [Lachnospiraceae bacterium]|nr:hypothetical protein [Lachnospiraceae bacterium]
MGFLENLGKSAGDSARKYKEDLIRIQNASSEELIRRLKHESNSSKKIAILNVLKDRGYSRDDLPI